ncbi:Uncharacterised protein [Escherichia coli]|uniref:Uncharacterized protein n=1 Tax=Escherichia coli TaxID=562 RepID=A0A376KNZ9_ECOLX|nr:Uncharacterised protein [Escherichia coli]
MTEHMDKTTTNCQSKVDRWRRFGSRCQNSGGSFEGLHKSLQQNDSASKNAAIAWANANLYQTPYISTTWIIQATITPKCWVDNVNLDLTFGTLSKSTLEGQVSSQKTLNISM